MIKTIIFFLFVTVGNFLVFQHGYAADNYALFNLARRTTVANLGRVVVDSHGTTHLVTPDQDNGVTGLAYYKIPKAGVAQRRFFIASGLAYNDDEGYFPVQLAIDKNDTVHIFWHYAENIPGTFNTGVGAGYVTVTRNNLISPLLKTIPERIADDYNGGRNIADLLLEATGRAHVVFLNRTLANWSEVTVQNGKLSPIRSLVNLDTCPALSASAVDPQGTLHFICQDFTSKNLAAYRAPLNSKVIKLGSFSAKGSVTKVLVFAKADGTTKILWQSLQQDSPTTDLVKNYQTMISPSGSFTFKGKGVTGGGQILRDVASTSSFPLDAALDRGGGLRVLAVKQNASNQSLITSLYSGSTLKSSTTLTKSITEIRDVLINLDGNNLYTVAWWANGADVFAPKEVYALRPSQSQPVLLTGLNDTAYAGDNFWKPDLAINSKGTAAVLWANEQSQAFGRETVVLTTD